MKNKMKRLLSMVLAVMMVVGLFPVSAFAAEDTTAVKGVDPNVAGDSVVYVAGEENLSCSYALTGEHTHSDSCYVVTCDHKDGHLSTCFASATTYELCTHSDDSQHTGSVNLADVVTINGRDIQWIQSHPAFTAVYAEYINLGGNGNAIQKGLAAAQLLTKKFCYTTAAGETPICGHYASYGESHSEVRGACYGIDAVQSALAGCKLYEHTHNDSCYTVNWTGYDDINNNEIIDGSEADPYVEIKYVDGKNGTIFADQTTQTVVSATTDIATPAAPSTENNLGWAFDEWSPAVAATVTGAATYTATWNPIVTFNYNNGNSDVENTVELGGTVEKPADPTMDWHNFNGWMLNNAVYDFASPVTEPITLTADWAEWGVSELVLSDYTVPYNQHSGDPMKDDSFLRDMLMNWMETFKVDGIGFNPLDNYNYYNEHKAARFAGLTFYLVTTGANGERVETELTAANWPTSEAGATVTVCATAAENPGVWQAAKSNDATLTLEAGPGANTLNLGSVSGASIKVEVNGVEQNFVNNAIALKKFQTTEDVADEVVITVTADDAYYLNESSLSVSGVSATAVVAEDLKTATITFSAGTYEGASYTVSVAAVAKLKPVIVAAEEAIVEVASDIGNISYTDEELKNKFGVEIQDPESTSTPDGISRNDITVSAVKNGDAARSGNGVNSLGEYTITFGYNGNNIYSASDPISRSLTITDGRPTAVINVNSNTAIGYVGDPIVESTILRALVESVTVEGNTVGDFNDTALVETYSSKIWKETVVAGFTLGYTTPVGAGIGGSTTDELAGIEGNYKVVISCADSDTYKGTQLEAYFSVYDNRPNSVVVANDVTREHEDISTINYDLDAVMAAFVADNAVQAQYEATGAGLGENANISITSITKANAESVLGYDVIYSNVAVSGSELVNNLPITEAGVYTVSFEVAESSTWKKGTGKATFTVVDAREESLIVLVENEVFSPETETFAYTQAELFDELFEGVDNGTGYYAKPETGLSYTFYKEVSTASGEESAWVELQGDITELGVYKLAVSFAGDNTRMPADDAFTTFNITDGRPVPVFAITNDEVPFDFNGFTKEDLIEAIGIYCENVSGLEYSNVRILKDNAEVQELAVDTYTVEVSFNENENYNHNVQEFTVNVVDARDESVLEVVDASVTYTGAALTLDEVTGLMFVSLNGEANAESLKVSGYDKAVNVGEYEVTFAFDGDAFNKPVEVKATLAITKASASVSVAEATLHYTNDNVAAGYNAENMISVSPAGAATINFAVGLSMGDKISNGLGTVVMVDLPKLIDVDSIENAFVREAVQYVINGLGNGGTMTVAELKTALEAIVSGLEAIEDLNVGANIDTNVINILIEALGTIEGMEGVGDLTVKLTMDQGLYVYNSGMYMVGSIVSDANTESAFSMNYLVVTPDGMKAELAWNVEDVNGFYTIGNIQNGKHDFGAYVSNILEGDIDLANAQVETVFLGVDMDGNPVMINDPKQLTLGAYTQIAYIADLGNTMYYAEPIIRPILVVAEAIQIKFIDENGNENPDRVYTWEDGVAREMKATAFSQTGKELAAEEQAKIKYTYIGIESDGDLYKSSKAPERPGTYTVIATYKDGNDVTRVGMGIGALAIMPKEATINVADVVRPYEAGKTDSLMGLISKSPADAKMAVMVAGITNVGDFTEQGLAAVEGVVYVDLPDRVESALKKIQNSEYVTVDNFKAMAAPLVAALEAAGISTADILAFYNELAALPGTLQVQFTDLSNYNFETMGAYVVVAGIMDNDYVPAIDTGLVMIHPELLDLNYDIKDVIYKWDGTEKAPEISNPNNARDILFIVDTQNKAVNIVAPSLGQDKDPNYNWDGDLHLQYWMDEMNKVLAEHGTDKETIVAAFNTLLNKLEELTGSTVIEAGALEELQKILADVDSDIVTLNGKLPTDAGIYKVYGIAYKDPSYKLEVSEGKIEIIKGFPIRFTADDADGAIVPGATVYIDGEARVLDEDCIVWDEELVLGRKMAVAYVYENSGDHTTSYDYSDNTKAMYIFDLVYDEAKQEYTAVRMNALDNVLDFGGASIWLCGTGVNGIRAYYKYNGETAAAVDAFATLGYKVTEHGNVVDWANNIGAGDAELREDGSNSAPGHYDAQYGMYYDEIYPLRDEYITPDLRIRSYAILEDLETGEITVLYSGSVERSIGYVAWQNRDAYKNNATHNGWVWNIINKAADQGITYA